MKFKSFIYAAMATALFAACSEKEVMEEALTTDATTPTERLASGYLAIEINLPTTNVSTARAANDDFADGTANEYAVNSGALLLFAGNTEKDAEFKAAYNLSLQDWTNDVDNDNITTSNLVAVKISNPAGDTEKLYGLVMLNFTGVGTVDGNNFKFNGATENFTGSFDKFVKTTSTTAAENTFYTVTDNVATNFLMLNAPISNVSSSSTAAPALENVTTLVNITNGLKSTEAEAKNNPAGSFFVERAVAKATLSNTAAGISGKKELTVKEMKWTLNATNNSSYIVRNMQDANFLGYKAPNRPYRMVGNAQIGTTAIQPAVNYFRTYWCYDPNYTAGDHHTVGLTYKDNSANDFVPAGDTPLYCYENTFDVAHQLHQNTTQALIKVTFNDGETFYTINDNQDVLYKSEEDAEALSIDYILHHAIILNAIQEAIKDKKDINNLTIDKSFLTVTFARDDNDGYHKVTNVAFNGDKFPSDVEPELTSTDVTTLCAAVNATYRIAEYKDGVSYYPVRFKHFAGVNATDINDLAPWNSKFVTGESYDYENYTDLDKTGDAENMWLGRYGMVRNNWYDVEVSAIKKLGRPSIKDLNVENDTTPDDEKEEWIAVKINILSWAKRTQSVTL